MSVSIKQNKQPKLSMPKFNVNKPLDEKLNRYEITSLMNVIIGGLSQFWVGYLLP
jgi:hypothetical protein